MALVVTLAMLVLLSGLIIVFLSTVRTDLTSAKSYEDGTNARMLADSALHLVIGQIREASTQPQVVWISQPGLIRTFQQNGDPAKAYKLYSSDHLVVSGGFDPVQDAASGTGDLPPNVPASDPQHWSKKPALWTDLNEPVADLQRPAANGAGSRLSYPIFDANYLTAATGHPETGQLSLSGSATTPDVEGFRIEDFDKRGATMPVKWLYMLKDGTLVGTSDDGQGNAKLSIPPGKDKTAQGEPNSIVARLAFWADDETAKVNVNTAAEGTFWDTPVCNTQPGVNNPIASGYQNNANLVYEWDLAERMGAINEYQRYPGHPAQTCLSAVLGEPLRQRLSLQPAQILTGATRASFVEELLKIAPRVAGKNYRPNGEAAGEDYSSRGGTIRAGSDQAGQWQKANDLSIRRVIADSDRLYATVDELAFAPPALTASSATDRSAAPLASRGGQDASRELLEMSKFFLTASSKAPEQNLFNLPRVAIWPVRDEENRRTAFDKLITFCSTVGDKKTGGAGWPLIFQRNRPTSGTYDWSSIPNNQRIYNYLKALTDRPVPGWKTTGANSLLAKYPQDRDQILTEIFDYIRCTNLVDQSDPLVPNAYYTDPKMNIEDGQGAPKADSMLSKRGQVTPIVIGSTRGFGRIATISELALVLVRKADTGSTAVDATKPNANIEFALLPEMFSPAAGFSSLANDLRIVFKNYQLTVNDGTSEQTLFPKQNSAGANLVYPDIYDVGRISDPEDFESKIGGIIGVRSLLEPSTDRQPRNRGAPSDSVPPTTELTVLKKVVGTAPNEADTRLTIKGSVDAEIWTPGAAGAANAELVQTLSFQFPETKVRLPAWVNQGEFATGDTASKVKGGRINGGQFQDTVIGGANDGDVVRALTAVGPLDAGGAGFTASSFRGDMRLVAARSTVDAGVFSALPNTRYFRETERMAHTLRSAWGHHFPGFFQLNPIGAASGPIVSPGLLLSGWTNYSTGTNWCSVNGTASTFPDIPEGINGVTNSAGLPGDWDNGPAWVLDGALINKADEGTTRHHHASASEGVLWENSTPYIGNYWAGQNFDSEQPTFFSPNRQISSPVMFGSLPTGVKAGHPWQTLLFRPAKSYLPGGTGHPGGSAAGIPDHLLLDLFWMPVVEPYAISEPFATAGKINLNSQVVPFTNLKRHTGLHAVLKSVKLTAINPDQPNRSDSSKLIWSYKISGVLGANVGHDGGGHGVPVRRNLDVENTVRLIDDRLQKNQPFVSASEICDIPLLPADTTDAPRTLVNAGITKDTPLDQIDTKLAQFWDKHRLTGDNSLERPYSMIYPRLTTKSNTYTVHVRVQTVRKLGTDPDRFVFKNGRDQVQGEFRGSFLLERYLDPNAAGFVKGNGETAVDETDPDAALGPYRFRVVSSKQFAP